MLLMYPCQVMMFILPPLVDYGVIDSAAFSHMIGIKNKFTSLHFSNKYPLINIANGSSATVVSDGTVHAASSLTLNNILFVPTFTISLLSISQIAKNNICFVTFYPAYCIFQNLQTRMRILWNVSNGECTI